MLQDPEWLCEDSRAAEIFPNEFRLSTTDCSPKLQHLDVSHDEASIPWQGHTGRIKWYEVPKAK